jgi:hypothetical protein
MFDRERSAILGRPVEPDDDGACWRVEPFAKPIVYANFNSRIAALSSSDTGQKQMALPRLFSKRK